MAHICVWAHAACLQLTVHLHAQFSRDIKTPTAAAAYGEDVPTGPLSARWRWHHLDSSRAWNYQQGPAAQWLGPSNRYLIFNDRGCGEGRDEVCSVVYDLQVF